MQELHQLRSVWRTCTCGERIVDTCPGDKRASTGPGTREFVCNLKNVWECMLLVHERDSPLAVCPQRCTVAHTLSPDVHIGDLPSHFEKSAERSGAVQELHHPRSARAETCPGKDWVNTGPWTGSTGSGNTRRPQKTSSLHACLPRSFSTGTSRDLRRNVGIPEEVQPGKRRTTNCVSDLGQVTLKGNAQTEDPLKVKEYNGGLSSCGVGARRCLGRSPASFWVGHPAGGARTFAPLFGSLLSSRETVHGVSLWCLSA